jgi:predicted hydrolase (HD superfamily)
MTLEFSRLDAWDLLREWTKSPSLLRHMLAVEGAMRAYAPRFGGDLELWGQTGLLHDMDYEAYPDLDTGHPRYAIKELSGRGYPLEMLHAIASHSDVMGVSRETDLDKCLYAVDELSGFVMAVSYVRPAGLKGMKTKSVKKKLAQPSFAAAVKRDDIIRGAEDLGVDLDAHIQFVIDALAARREQLTDDAGQTDWRDQGVKDF